MKVFWCSASRINPVQQALSGSGQEKLPNKEHYFLYSNVSLNTFLASQNNPWILLAREIGPILHNTLFFPLVFPNSFWTQYPVEDLPSKNSHSQIPYYERHILCVEFITFQFYVMFSCFGMGKEWHWSFPKIIHLTKHLLEIQGYCQPCLLHVHTGWLIESTRFKKSVRKDTYTDNFPTKTF